MGVLSLHSQLFYIARGFISVGEEHAKLNTWDFWGKKAECRALGGRHMEQSSLTRNEPPGEHLQSPLNVSTPPAVPFSRLKCKRLANMALQEKKA